MTPNPRIRTRQNRRSQADPAKPLPTPSELTRQQNRFDLIAVIALTAFAAYLAVIYFAHQTIPNSDFPAFLETGRQILSLEAPASYKRLPGLGITQTLLSSLLPGPHPALTAGWLLNVILFTATAPLLYLIARRIIPRTAPWFTLIALINPWTLTMIGQPIVEIPLVFLISLSFFFILKPSRWAYPVIAIAATFRHEAAILIPIMFTVDICHNKPLRQRLLALTYSALASLPIAAWLLAMFLNQNKDSLAKSSYMDGYLAQGSSIVEFAKYTWYTAVGSLFGTTTVSAFSTIAAINQILLTILLLTALAYAINKKNWRTLTIAAFVLIYFLLHATRSFTILRYAIPTIPFVVLLAFTGAANLLTLAARFIKLPTPVKAGLHIFLLPFLVLWALALLPSHSSASKVSPASASVPIIAVVLATALVITHATLTKARRLLPNITILAMLLVMIASNQLILAKALGTGQKDYEFKMLADWYRQNAPGQKLVTTMPHIIALFDPAHKDAFIPTSRVRGDNLREFTSAALEQSVKYVAWDSRIGLYPDDKYYKQWNMQKVAPLAKPRDLGPYKFTAQLKRNQHRYINIFKLTPKNPQSAKTNK